MGSLLLAVIYLIFISLGLIDARKTDIGLQMASAYVGSTFMPMVLGILQELIGIAIMPVYLLIFAVLNIGLLEIAYRQAELTWRNKISLLYYIRK